VPRFCGRRYGLVKSAVNLMHQVVDVRDRYRAVLLARQQRVFLTLDVAALAAREPRILALANRIQGLAQMADDMEFVEQNRRLRGMRISRQTKRRCRLSNKKPLEQKGLSGAQYTSSISPKPLRAELLDVRNARRRVGLDQEQGRPSHFNISQSNSQSSSSVQICTDGGKLHT
jgi:hypothetical protein